MSISKENILTFCNAKLLREDAEADILDEIQLVIDDLSKRAKWPVLYRANVAEDRKTLASGTSASDLPTGFRVLDYIVINDGDNDGRPLGHITFEKWLRRREDESSSNYDEPKNKIIRGGKVYWDPIPDGAYTAKFWFWRHHPTVAEATDDILFGDEFNRLFKYGACAEVAKTHKRKQDIDLWEPRYMAEVEKMVPEEDLKTALVEYQD